MEAVNQNIFAQKTFMIMFSMFLSVGHIYALLLLYKMKIKQTENNTMLYFLQKRNYRRSKVKLRKIRNLYHKKRSCLYICGRDGVLWRNIRLGLSPFDTWKIKFASQKEILKLLLHNEDHIFQKILYPLSQSCEYWEKGCHYFVLRIFCSYFRRIRSNIKVYETKVYLTTKK